MILNTNTIAVDFDGTIVDDEYPKIGKAKLFAFDTLVKLQENGHRLILWTYRTGKSLEDAVQFCADNGIIFYAVTVWRGSVTEVADRGEGDGNARRQRNDPQILRTSQIMTTGRGQPSKQLPRRVRMRYSDYCLVALGGAPRHGSQQLGDVMSVRSPLLAHRPPSAIVIQWPTLVSGQQATGRPR